jgi:hypothetical protein
VAWVPASGGYPPSGNLLEVVAFAPTGGPIVGALLVQSTGSNERGGKMTTIDLIAQARKRYLASPKSRLDEIRYQRLLAGLQQQRQGG